MSRFPLAARVVEVIADRGEAVHPRYRYGSGCVVAGCTVLTAAHVVDGAVCVRVRDPGKALSEAELDPRFVGDPDGPGPDLALVELTSGSAPNVPTMSLAAVDRDSVTADPVERCHVIGYPAFMERDVAGGGRLRETADAFGHVPVLSGLARGLLSVQVSSVPRPLPPVDSALGDSEWSGMSGGPVVANGLLLGVVTEHAPREGSSAITATPLTALEADPAHPGWGPGVSNPGEWWARLGVSGLGKLHKVPGPRRLPEAAYWATVREVHRRTPQLLGRARELAALSAFATGQDGCRWLLGSAWAGKTALVAEAVTSALPPEVDVVVYFLSRREADADSNHFLAAVVPQLAALIGEEPQVLDLHQFRALWERAVERAATADRHLLLMVDGLDEDLRPPGSPSVAGLLPAEVGGFAHVLVTSRAHPELPVDMPVRHPLRQVGHTALEPSEYAEQLSNLARQEIGDLLHRENVGLAAEVFGLLAAAAGPLAISDIVALIGDLAMLPTDKSRLIHRLITEEAARSLQPVGPAERPRYQFAHASLLEYAQTDINPQHRNYRQRIHQWAQSWENKGWPTTDVSGGQDCPLYLLEAYPATLVSDVQRLVRLVSDIDWVVAAIQRVGVDSVLAHLRTARSAAPTHVGVSRIFRAVQRQANHLRPPEPVSDRDYVLCQLCLQAMELADDHLSAVTRTRLLALNDTGPIPLWTTRRANPAVSAKFGQGLPLRAMAALSDGRVVTGGMDGRVLVWDPESPGAAPTELGRHNAWAKAVAVLPDGRVVTGGDDKRVLVWDPASPGAAPTELGRHESQSVGGVRAVAVLADGRVVTGGDDKRVLVWDPTSPGAAPTELGRHSKPSLLPSVNALASLRTGRVVTSGADGRILVWDPAKTGAAPVELGRDVWRVNAMAALPNGQVVTGAANGQILIWDPAKPGARPFEIGVHRDSVEAVAVLPDGRVVTGGGQGHILVWDPARSAAPVELGRHDGWADALVVLPDGRVASSGGREGGVRVWDLVAAQIVSAALGDREGTVEAVGLLPDGRVVSGGHDRQIRVWDPARPGAAPVELGHHNDWVRAMAVLPDGRVVSSGDDGRVLVWNPARARRAAVELGRHLNWVRAVAVLPDGRVVSGGHDEWILVWDPARPGAAPVELGPHHGWVRAVAALPDGRVVTGGFDGRVLVWDPASPGAAPAQLGSHSGWVQAVGALPDGRVVSGGVDGWVLVWDPASPGAAPAQLGNHFGIVEAVLALADGRVVSGGRDGRVLVWDASAQVEISRVACSAMALAASIQLGTGECRLAMAHESVGISLWLIPALRRMVPDHGEAAIR